MHTFNSSKTPEDILRLALEAFDKVAISFSGAEDVVLVDMVSRIRSDVRVFSLDTGRLHPETYRFLEGRAAALPAPVVRRLGHRAAKGSRPRDARHHRGHRARCSVLDARACPSQVQPLANSTVAEGWDYIRSNVPYNELHERGFVSIVDPKIELAQNYGRNDRQLRAAFRLIEGHQDGIRDAWRRHFPG